MKRFAMAFALVLALSVEAVAAAEDPDAARAGIARERDAIEAAFRQADAECKTRFAVNSCMEQARGERRKALATVRERELALDDAQRRERAADRRRSVVEKQAAVQQRAASAPASAVSVVVRPPRVAASGPAGAEPPRSSNAPLDGGPQAAAARASEAAARAKEFEARQARIAERERNRTSGGRQPSQPLPVPATAASSPR